MPPWQTEPLGLSRSSAKGVCGGRASKLRSGRAPLKSQALNRTCVSQSLLRLRRRAGMSALLLVLESQDIAAELGVRASVFVFRSGEA